TRDRRSRHPWWWHRPVAPGSWRGSHRRWRRLSVKPWVTLSCSGLEDVEGALDHPPRGADDVEVRLVGSLRLVHGGHFDHRLDVGIFDVAQRIRGRIARLVLAAELRAIGPHLAERH